MWKQISTCWTSHRVLFPRLKMYAVIHDEMLKSLEHLDADTKGKIVMAYIEYQINWVEPSKDDLLVYSIFKSKQFDLDSIKSRAEVARENGKKWGRPRKDLSVENKSKTKKTQQNPTITQANPSITQKNQDKEKEKEKEKENNIKIIDNKLSITEDKSSDNITWDINNLISELKELSNEMWIAYENKDERNFSKHILTAKTYWEFCSKINQTRSEFAKNIMKASVMIWYWKWPCSWPKAIYQNYVEVYNLSRKEQIKQQKNKIYSF